MNRLSSDKKREWILFIHQIPPKPTSVRVRVWRRFQKIGAMPIKNSIYVLPFAKETYEIFQWLRQEIIAQKGEAMIVKTDAIEGINDQDIIKKFQSTRDKNYQEIISHSFKLKKDVKANLKKGNVSPAQKENYETELKKLKLRLNEIISLDYFQAPNREKAEKAITEINQLIESIKGFQEKPRSVEKGSPTKIYNRKEFLNKTWITRKGLHIDRMASGWLIKRFIDKGAKFSFVAEDEVLGNGIGFDVYNAEFSHAGEDCTFETLLKSFNLKDSALVQLAEIVHDIDLKDEKFDRKEAEGINQIIIGLSQRLRNDKKLMERGMEIFDSLYYYYSLRDERS